MKYPLLLLSSGWWLLAAWCSGRGVCKQPWSGGHWGSPTQLVISVFNPSQPPGLLQRLQLTAGEVNWKPAICQQSGCWWPGMALWLLMAWEGRVAADDLGRQCGCWWPWEGSTAYDDLGGQCSCCWAVWLLMTWEGSMTADDLGGQSGSLWPWRAVRLLMTWGQYGSWWPRRAVGLLMAWEGSMATDDLGGQNGYWWLRKAV